MRKAVYVGLQVSPDTDRIISELVWNRLHEQSQLTPLVEEFADETARIHFGADELLESEHLRRVVRLFYAWRVVTVRDRLGADAGQGRFLDVGDTDGLMLKALGKSGTGFNISAAAVENIESNGITAVLGDGHELPFEDASFDVVLCFETLEHVENPQQVLAQLARVCSPEGRIFISIPAVPHTHVVPRRLGVQRGYEHVFEMSRDDFGNLVTHTPLRITWESVCNVIGKPVTFEQRRFLLANTGHIVGGTFRGFRFFELRNGAES